MHWWFAKAPIGTFANRSFCLLFLVCCLFVISFVHAASNFFSALTPPSSLVDLLRPALLNDPKFTTLEIMEKRLTDADMVIVAAALAQNKHIIAIWMCENAVTMME